MHDFALESALSALMGILTRSLSHFRGYNRGVIGKLAKGKVAVFIDAANIFYSQRTLGWRIDYEKLAKYMARETKLDGLYYYTGKVGTLEKQMSFIDKLKRCGYRVVAKEVKMIKVPDSAPVPKGSLDIELALDAYRFRKQFDTLVLFSGDSDFAYLLDLLKLEGKRVIVVSMRGHVAKELLERAKFIALPKLRDFIKKAEKIKRPDEPASEV